MRNLALTTAVLLIAVSFAQASLISNGSFEGAAPTVLSTGSTPNNNEWYWQGSSHVTLDTARVHEGTTSLKAQNPNSSNLSYYVFQFIDSSSMGPGDFELSGWVWKRYSSVGTMRMKVFGWEGTPNIHSGTGTPEGGTYDTLLDWFSSDYELSWEEVTQSFSTSKTYDRIQVQLAIVSLRSNGYAYWDEITLTPEPTTLGLLGLGGLSILRRKRR